MCKYGGVVALLVRDNERTSELVKTRKRGGFVASRTNSGYALSRTEQRKKTTRMVSGMASLHQAQ